MAKRAAWRGYAHGTEMDEFADFCAEFCEQSEDRWAGERLVLERWQRRMMGEALAYDSRGWPVWQSVAIIVPRKNGKTQLLAALALYRLLTDDGRPEILLAASSDKQAGRLYDAVSRFVRRSPELAGLCRVRDHEGEIVREDGLGIIYRLSSDPKRLHGYNPTLVVCDELAQWTTPKLRATFAALTSAGGARQAPQVFTITTAGEAATRHDSILGRIVDAVPGDAERDGALTIGRLVEARTLVWNYEAPTTDAMDAAALKRANPASWITTEFLRRQAANPELSDSDVLQLHGCVWAAADTTFVAPDDWISCRVDRRFEPGEAVVLGFDGSETRDATVLSATTLDGFTAPLMVWERPSGAGQGWKIPRDEIHQWVDYAFSTYEVVELAADPPGWYTEIDRWRDLYGEERVVDFETKQYKRFAPACERFQKAAQNHELTHDGHAVLAKHLGNAVAQQSPWGVIVHKDHPDSPRKIDALVASIISHDRAAWHATHRDQKQRWGAIA